MNTHTTDTVRMTDELWEVLCPQCGYHVIFRTGSIERLATGEPGVKHRGGYGGLTVISTTIEADDFDAKFWNEAMR